MNQIYRVIFNHATGVYQCVSEFARAKGKTKSIKALVVAVGLAMGGQVWATDFTTDTTVNAQALNNDTHTISNGVKVTIEPNNQEQGYIDNANISINNGSLISDKYVSLNIASDTGAISTINVTGATSSIELIGAMKLGEKGDGTLNISNGAKVTTTRNAELGKTGIANVTVSNGATFDVGNQLLIASNMFGSNSDNPGNANLTIKDNSTVNVGWNVVMSGKPNSNSKIVIDNKSKLQTGDRYSISIGDAEDNAEISLTNESEIKTNGMLIGNSAKLAIENKSMISANEYFSNSGKVILNDSTLTTGRLNMIAGGVSRSLDQATFVSKNGTITAQQINISENSLMDTTSSTIVVNGGLLIDNLNINNKDATFIAKDSTLTANNWIVVGNGGAGKMTLDDSTIKTGTLVVGNGAGGVGELVSNKGAIDVATFSVAGNNNTGTVTAADTVINADLFIMANKKGVATVTLDNTTLTTTNAQIADDGTGQMAVKNGSTLTVKNQLLLTNQNSSDTASGKLTINNSSADIKTVLIYGAGEGMLTAKDSTLTISNIDRANNVKQATLAFDNTLINIKEPQVSLFNNFKNTDTITLTNDVTFNTAKDTTIDANARITGTGNFIKDGTGKLTLDVASKNWTGETHIDKGVLELNGDYTMRDGEVLAVAVNDGANDYGKLIVKGTADIKDGTLKVKASDIVKDLTTGNTSTGEWKDVVTADTLNTQFKAVNVVDKAGATIANSTIEADYTDVNKVHLRVAVQPQPPQPPVTDVFTPVVVADNNIVSIPLATVLDNQVNNPTANNVNLVTAVTLGSSGLTDKEISRGVSELQPLFMGVVNRILHDSHAHVGTKLDNRLIERDSALWVEGFGEHSSHNHKHSVAGYEVDEKGVIIGADKVFGNAQLGVAVAVSDISGKTTDTIRHRLDARTLMGMVYGSYAVNDQTALTAVASIGKANIDGNRHIDTFASTNAVSDYKADMFGGSIGVTHQIGGDDRYLQPFVRLDYHAVQADAYQETQAGVYNLSVNEQSQSVLEGVIGVNAKTDLTQNLALTGRLAAHIQNGDTKNRITASFAGISDSQFTTIGHKVGGVAGMAGVGLTYTPSPTTKLELNYQGEWRDGFDNQGVVLGFSKSF